MDQISDQVILLSYGYVVAEGQIRGVREEVKDHPMQILVRCDRPGVLAARLFDAEAMVEAKWSAGEGLRGHGLLIRTTDANAFYLTEPHCPEDGIAWSRSLRPTMMCSRCTST